MPLFFKPILWSFDFSNISPKEDKRLIIINTINYGDLRHWRWISNFYGKEEIRKVLCQAPASQIRKRVRPLAAIIFKIKEFGNEKRSINRKR